MIRKLLLPAAAACLLFTSGCALFRSPAAKINWESTDYSIDDIKAMRIQSEDNCKIGDESDDDCTKQALKAYNVMFGYVENQADFDYKVYDFYHVNFDSVKGYVIKIVPEDRAELAEQDAGYTLSDEEILMLSCSEQGTKVKGQIETYLMARRWTEELTAEFAESFPEYHLNTQYISLDYVVPSVTAENYTDRDDYTHFFKENFYESSISFYDNIVNVIVPADADESKAKEIYSDIEPILRKYYVSEVNIVSPVSDEIRDKWLAEEEISGNYYYYKDDEKQWLEHFSLMN